MLHAYLPKQRPVVRHGNVSGIVSVNHFGNPPQPARFLRILCLFTDFVQLDPGAPRRYGGTSLALALTARSMSCEAAQPALESEVGKGSSVAVVLPSAMAKVNV